MIVRTVSRRDRVAQTIRDLYDAAEPGAYLGSVASLSKQADKAGTATVVDSVVEARKNGLDIHAIRGAYDGVRSFGGYYRGPAEAILEVNKIPADSAAARAAC